MAKSSKVVLALVSFLLLEASISAAPIAESRSVIPSLFQTILSPTRGTGLGPNEAFTYILNVFGHFGNLPYNDVTRGCSCGGARSVRVNAQPIQGKEDQFLDKVALWGLFSCTQKLVQGGLTPEGLLKPGRCSLQMPQGNEIGTVVFENGGPMLNVPKVFSNGPASPLGGALVNGNNSGYGSLVSRDPRPNANSDSSPSILLSDSKLVPRNSTLAEPNQDSTACSCTGNGFDSTRAQIGRLGNPLDAKAVTLTLMEVGLDLASKQPRQDSLGNQWGYEYTSVAEGLTMSLKASATTQPPLSFKNVIQGTTSIGAGFVQARVPWSECDFRFLETRYHALEEARQRFVVDGNLKKT